MNNFLADYGMWIWVAVLVLCVVIEALTFELTTIWGAIGAVPVIFISLTKINFPWQILIFLVLTTVLAFVTRPFAVKKLKIGKNKTNVDSLIDTECLVIKKISRFEKGEVKTQNGVIWTAKTADETELEPETYCKIKAIEGNTLIVE